MTYPRKPTDDEWDGLVQDFPSLDRKTCWITGAATGTYNCIAFTLGIFNRWINPSSPLAAFEKQYAAYNFEPVAQPAATVDGWGSKPSGKVMHHGSRTALDPGFAAQGLWESKLGQDFRITHGRAGLTSDLYGIRLTYLAEDDLLTESQLPPMEPELTEQERARLAELAGLRLAASLLDADAEELTAAFEARRAEFRAAVRRSRSSDTADFAALPEAEALRALGPAIVPLLAALLAEEDGFVYLGTLEALSPGLTLVDYHPLAGEQSRARLVARAWLATAE